MDDANYTVSRESFADNHYAKSFLKKYKDKWSIAYDTIVFGLQRVDNLLKTDKADLISENEHLRIVKIQFRIPGTKESAKSSGNRCIAVVNDDELTVKILLIYSKTDLSGKNETKEWKAIIKNIYPEYGEML